MYHNKKVFVCFFLFQKKKMVYFFVVKDFFWGENVESVERYKLIKKKDKNIEHIKDNIIKEKNI